MYELRLSFPQYGKKLILTSAKSRVLLIFSFLYLEYFPRKEIKLEVFKSCSQSLRAITARRFLAICYFNCFNELKRPALTDALDTLLLSSRVSTISFIPVCLIPECY